MFQTKFKGQVAVGTRLAGINAGHRATSPLVSNSVADLVTAVANTLMQIVTILMTGPGETSTHLFFFLYGLPSPSVLSVCSHVLYESYTYSMCRSSCVSFAADDSEEKLRL